MFVCVLCPKGCDISVSEQDGNLLVKGNACPKGIDFAHQEWFAPKRMVTSTVRTLSDQFPRLPVRTSGSVPKKDVFKVMQQINAVVVTLPVVVGQVIIEDVLGLGIDIVATMSLGEV